MAHLAFSVSEKDFPLWVKAIRAEKHPIVVPPKEQRGGETILFQSPGRNIIEICYPRVKETIRLQLS